MEKTKKNNNEKIVSFFDDNDSGFKLWQTPKFEEETKLKTQQVLAKTQFYKKGKRFGLKTMRWYYLCKDYIFYKKVKKQF